MANLIGRTTSIQAIINALAKRGCSNLTPSINLAACSEFPCAGGGFCDVFRGELYEGTRVAIKCLRVYDGPESEGNGERCKLLKRAARELYHWSKLGHPNVLPLLGLAIFRGHISMISEWMGNGNLMSYLKLNSNADRNKLCLDICEGLCYIHTNGMVHGDLKAANVMVSSEGTALIADFGNAHLKDLTLKFTSTNKGGLSVRWAAPELLLEDGSPQVSKEADIYAYGMVILEVMTGQVPFEGTRDNRVICLVAYEQKIPPRPSTDMGDGLWDLMTSCWDPVPSIRPKITTLQHSLRLLFNVCLPEVSQPARPFYGVLSPIPAKPQYHFIPWFEATLEWAYHLLEHRRTMLKWAGVIAEELHWVVGWDSLSPTVYRYRAQLRDQPRLVLGRALPVVGEVDYTPVIHPVQEPDLSRNRYPVWWLLTCILVAVSIWDVAVKLFAAGSGPEGVQIVS